jgi:hypothetical protein
MANEIKRWKPLGSEYFFTPGKTRQSQFARKYAGMKDTRTLDPLVLEVDIYECQGCRSLYQPVSYSYPDLLASGCTACGRFYFRKVLE